MGYYGTSGKPKPTYKPTPLSAGGSLGSTGGGSPSSEGVGKGSIDTTDLVGSIGETLGSFGGFLGTVGGGVAGVLGSLGPDGETASLGQLAEDLGRIPGGIGDIKRDANDPTAPTLGQATGMGLGVAGDVITAPGRFVEFEAAKGRVGGGPNIDPRGLIPGVGSVLMAADAARGVNPQELPADLQDALDAGQMTVDQVAEALVERGQGFSSDPVGNLVGQIVFDPLNIIAPGLSKVAKGVKAAGVSVRGGKELAQLGMTERAAGTIYNATTKGLSQAGAAAMDKVIGPVTSGVLHVIGTKSYKTLISGAGKLDRSYGLNFERSFALGAGQMPRAVIARGIMNDVGSRLARKTANVEGRVQRQLLAARTYARDELERRTEELLARVTPAFSVIDDAVTDLTIRKYAAASGMGVEDATRVLGGKVDRNTARAVDLAYYGREGGELAELKKVIPSSKKLDVERLTVIAHHNLTDELADQIIAGDMLVVEATERFSVLGNHFLGKQVSDAEVIEFVTKLKKEGALPGIVKLPKSGKNALPRELGDWRARNAEFGYDLGFAPKDGWKVLIDDEGNVLMSDPFVHFVSDVDPVTMRNPLGRFMDGLMRGTTQTTIVQQSRERMVDFVVRKGLPISPNEIRSVHKAILEEAADRSITPRALAGERTRGGKLFHEIFRRHMSDESYEALTDKFDPTYVVMHAFEGNWKTVGLTQKLTGRVKAAPQGGEIIARITESLYPKARFTYRPTFQAQEAIESPVFNAMRGVTTREVPDDLLVAYRQLAEQPEFRYLAQAEMLSIAGQRVTTQFMGANTAVGRAMGRFANIAGRKNDAMVRQVMFEHGDEFKEAVQTINPKFWRRMEEAYGTTDARVIADRFLHERMVLGANENIDEAMGLIDEATAGLKATLDDAVIRPGQEAASQAANVRVSLAKGGSEASGGAMKAEGALPSAASDMVLQAFKDSFRKQSNIAFQTHFFNPQRGWLERSLNHPYLGLYPLSYMWGKVLPEFMRFLVKRPFGVDAPLVGAVNLERVQQAYLGALADDPEFRAYIEENENAIYFANLLFPGNPTNMTVNAPAWARHVAEDVGAGRKITGETVTREIADSAAYATGPAYDLTQAAKVGADLVGMGEDIFANLDRAAAQFDGQFPQGAPRPPLGGQTLAP